MAHVRPVSRAPCLAQSQVSFLEQLVILVFTVLFGDYQNFPQIIQNLQKFYTKTP